MKIRQYPNRQFIYDAMNARAISRVARELVFKRSTDYLWHMNKQAYKTSLGRASSHPAAIGIKRKFPQEWKEYFKYTIVRNPFAVAVSSWRQRVVNRNGYFSFPEYMQTWAETQNLEASDMHIPNWDIVSVDDRIEIDLVLRHESLQNDLAHLSRQLGLMIDMPRVNVLERPTSYREHYCPETRKLAEAMFEKELNAFSYEY